MTLNVSKYTYELDPSGTLESNRVKGDEYTISPQVDGETRYKIVKAAPYFTANAELYIINENTNTKTLLKKYGDWKPIIPMDTVLSTILREVCVGFAILDNTISGRVSFDYNTLGGDFTVNDELVLTEIANHLANPLSVHYEDILDKPDVFPPDTHYLDSLNIDGMARLIQVIENNSYFTEQLKQQFVDVLTKHINDTEMHASAKKLNALSFLNGASIATDEEAKLGVSSKKIIIAKNLPVITKIGKDYTDEKIKGVNSDLTTFKESINNVKNYPIASVLSDYVATNRTMYAVIADIFTVLNQQYASTADALQSGITNKIISPSTLWSVLSKQVTSDTTSVSTTIAPSMEIFSSLLSTVNDLQSFKTTITKGSKLAAGWCTLPNGTILQWGAIDYTTTPPEADVRITYPISFTTGVLNVQAVRKMASGNSTAQDGGVLISGDPDLTGFNLNLAIFNTNASAALRGAYWFAIGY